MPPPGPSASLALETPVGSTRRPAAPVIFFWEYVHRLAARLIGVVFAVPLLYFWARGTLTRPLAARLLALFTLGAAQGLLGWLMVKKVPIALGVARQVLALVVGGVWVLWMYHLATSRAPISRGTAAQTRSARA